MLSFDEAVVRLKAYQDALDEALRLGPVEYDGLFDSPPKGIGAHEIDTQRIVRRVNAGELSLLGYRAEEMVGHPIVDFIVLQRVSEQAIDHKLHGEWALRPFSRTFRRADGSNIYLALVDRHLRDPRTDAVTGIRTAMMEAQSLL